MKKILFISMLSCIVITLHAQKIQMAKKPSLPTSSTTTQTMTNVSKQPTSSTTTTQTMTNVSKQTSNKASQQTVNNFNKINISYQGMISFQTPIIQKMQQEWQTNLSQIGGSKIQVQLWQVDYQPDNKLKGYTNIVLQQQVNADISYQVSDSSINYKINTSKLNINAAPVNGKLVVLVFSPSVQLQPDIRVKGKPNDGSATGLLHHYESNVKSFLINKKFSSIKGKSNNNNIVYGIYSIVPGQTDLSHINFGFIVPGSKAGCKNCLTTMDLGSDIMGFVDDVGDFAKQVINGVEYVFNQTIDGVSGLAKFVINGAADATGYFINQAGLILYEAGGALVNLIVFGNLPQERSLYQWEYDWANNKIFNRELPDIGIIKVFNFMSPDNHRFYTWPSPAGDYIFMNIGDAFDNPIAYVDNINHAYKFPGQVFIHELSHAWQIKILGFKGMMANYAAGGQGQTYDPGCGINNINSHFNLEQQATLVDRTFQQLYYQTKDDKSCTAFQQQWVENNVRHGLKFDVAKINATIAMQQHGKSFSAFIGNVNNAEANYSTGNGKNDDGYWMLGSKPESFLYYTNKDKKAYVNWGEIRKKYISVKAEHGVLGWPQTDMNNSLRNGGSFQHFQYGSIYSTPGFGTFIVDGAIRDAWASHKWENGDLGYPLSDFIPDNNGTAAANNSRFAQTTLIRRGGSQKFEHGLIKWNGIPGSQAEVDKIVIGLEKQRLIH